LYTEKTLIFWREYLPTKTPGERLRNARVRLSLTTREVDELSRRVAVEKGDEDFVVSHARLVQIENGESTPSIYKLYSLSLIYGCRVTELMSLYVDLSDMMRQHLALGLSATREPEKISFPIRFDPAFNLQKSAMLSRMVEVWGDLPSGLLKHLELRRGRWGIVGLGDYTMYPLLRPGSLVQIDDRQRPGAPAVYRSEYDRPIYFIELRDGYLCSWCEFHKGRLVVVPHPLSGVSTRQYLVPSEAEVIGRVTAVAARLVPAATQDSTQPAPSRVEIDSQRVAEAPEH
jgi:transcriptional regulator with XRE-family HTH domain